MLLAGCGSWACACATRCRGRVRARERAARPRAPRPRPAPPPPRRPRPASTGPIAPATQRAYDDALALMRAGHAADAERGLRALTQSDPDLAGPHANLGVIARQAGHLPEAVKRAREGHHARARPGRRLEPAGPRVSPERRVHEGARRLRPRAGHRPELRQRGAEPRRARRPVPGRRRARAGALHALPRADARRRPRRHQVGGRREEPQARRGAALPPAPAPAAAAAPKEKS